MALQNPLEEAPCRIFRKALGLERVGGMTSVKESMFFGVPMAVFPEVHDQLGCSTRVREKGVGYVEDISKVTPEYMLPRQSE